MGRYTNPHLLNARRSLWHFLLWKIGYYDDSDRAEKPPPDFAYPATAPPFQRRDPSALWIGHSSFLIAIDGLTFLTDPIWASYCSPVPISRLRRRTPPPLTLEALPPIDFVLLSHNHYDHLDAKTVKYLKIHQPQIEWIIPAGLSHWFHRRGLFKTRELPWWQSHRLSHLSITAVPTQHFSGRTLWDRDKTHWNGYVVQISGKQFYFAGDTGYNDHDFKEIGNRWRAMDLSLIPIGTYVPKQFMRTVHVSPLEAVQIHLDVGSCLSLGMHWNTFCLSDEPLDSPPYDLYLAMKAKGLPLASFLPLSEGTYINW